LTNRHWEERSDAAIHAAAGELSGLAGDLTTLDCFASLAMTGIAPELI